MAELQDGSDDNEDDMILASFCTEPAFRFRDHLYPELHMPIFLDRAATGGHLEHLDDLEEITLAMEEAEKHATAHREKISCRSERRRLKRKRGLCSRRLPKWFSHVTMVLCITYCLVMSSITMVYGIKFTLRAEEADRQAELALVEGANVTTVNGSMFIRLNASEALARDLITEKELATVLNSTIDEAMLMLNETVEVVRKVVMEGGSEASRFIKVSSMGLFIDIGVSQPFRVFVIAFATVFAAGMIDKCNGALEILDNI
jgi:hypothetical protein